MAIFLVIGKLTHMYMYSRFHRADTLTCRRLKGSTNIGYTKFSPKCFYLSSENNPLFVVAVHALRQPPEVSENPQIWLNSPILESLNMCYAIDIVIVYPNISFQENTAIN